MTLLGALTLLPRRSLGGGLTDNIDVVQVTPFCGGEVARWVGPPNLAPIAPGRVTSGFTLGGVAGVRLGPLSLGLLTQTTTAFDPQTGTFDMDKVYGELGLNEPLGRLVVQGQIDFGYAYLVLRDSTVRGVGGKFGMSADFYPVRAVSVGGGAAFDVQIYPMGKSDFIAGLGGSFVARLGLHL